MGQYKLTIYRSWQLGFLIQIDSDFIIIDLPFISIMYGLHESAQGYFIFGKFFNNK